MIGAFVVSILVIIALSMYAAHMHGKRQKQASYQLPAGAADILQQQVHFYQGLNDAQKQLFLSRVRDFLSRTAITPVKDTVVEDIDRLFIAAGAIIPIFSFPDWRYNNIDEVLLYKTSFSDKYQTIGEGRDILGMVGDGPMNRTMLLSQEAVRRGFMNPEDGRNTVIHEFTHLLDKADGQIDGVPEYLLSKQYIIPWVKYMHNEIRYMRDWGTDINPYGATNESEFLAVIAEYFFERPEQLQQNHPDIYDMLNKMFTRPQVLSK